MDYNDFQAGHTKENFWFKGKRFLIKELMIKSFGSRKDLKILNAGAGTGDVLEILDKFGKNYIIDINKKALSTKYLLFSKILNFAKSKIHPCSRIDKFKF